MKLPLELLNTLIAGLTLVVIAATAFAALVQLRHLRAGNTLTGLLAILQNWQDPQLQAWFTYTRTELPKRMGDPSFWESLNEHPIDRALHPELYACDWYEQLGAVLKHGLLDERIFMDVGAGSVGAIWAQCEPVIVKMRETRGPTVYENFEYAAARGALSLKRFPDGHYPKNTPRMAQLVAESRASAKPASA